MRAIFVIETDIEDERALSLMQELVAKANCELPHVTRLFVGINETADLVVHILEKGPQW